MITIKDGRYVIDPEDPPRLKESPRISVPQPRDITLPDAEIIESPEDWIQDENGDWIQRKDRKKSHPRPSKSKFAPTSAEGILKRFGGY